ncbi:acetolactate synthase large subunit [Thermosporothrix hazakensis]|jgi:acetolactate synthase-1/2/3 large subunit|uniref:Acetolactate synthase n=1 Tax=Thermosporothrix hazakensis TaxID=644383 RepID=A0A326UD16_THEHA|nr:biosynthetic-type acetolactate synthase large subunit [Thermosporothrix hazakensis]PZW36216.1 acetolactate synthase large subunit [Thermosporothrix hazakensis]GCE46866.1 acetolactate synthase [Thermosporothrix hazakensis]
MAIATNIIRQTERPDLYNEARELPGSHIICEALLREGVEFVWGYPGGAIMPFYDSITSYPSIHHVLVRHEQAASHAADGYARITGKVGVCTATSGPGATNLVTGLATAYMDSVPVVAITGQVGRPLLGRDAFQETDILGITLPVTKHSILVRSIEEIAPAIHEAFRIAQSGRPGPVVVDIPKDVQQQKGWYDPSRHESAYDYFRKEESRHEKPEATLIEQAAKLISQARKPLIMAGHGIILSNAYAELKAFAEKTGIPVIATLLGLSAFPDSHPLFLGMPGMHGPAHVNRAIGEADLIVGVGLRFDDRVTGKVDEFAPKAALIHIDIDPSEVSKVKVANVPLVADAKVALAALNEAVKPGDHASWLQEIRDWQAQDEGRAAALKRDETLPSPMGILHAINEVTEGKAIVVSDVGQHQMWTARFYPWSRANSQITSGGLGTMGFALPAAMGVKMGAPEAPVWVVAGDGGIQMNIQEMATLMQEGVEIKIAIMNNGYLGMVRQWQQFFHSRNYSETPITGPDYVKLAEAYGATGMRVTRGEDVTSAIKRAMETPGPVIVDFVIEAEACVYPMVAPGSPITTMIEEQAEENE